MDPPPDPNAHRYANMSYINYLTRQQRMIERGISIDDFEDEEEGQSEDESNFSDGEESPEKGKNSTKGG